MRILALLVVLLVCARPVAAQSTFFHFSSQPGDYVGQGQVFTIQPDPADFDVRRNPDNGVSVLIWTDGPSVGQLWMADFAAAGDVPLTPGTYADATRYPFQASTAHGLNISGDSRNCNTLTGHFTVLEIVFGVGTTVTRFAADFEQHCEGAAPALVGFVRFNSSLPPPVTVSPAVITTGAGPSTTPLQVIGIPGIPFTASTSTPWLSVPATATGGVLPVTAARNPTTAPRTGTVLVGNTTVVVTQRANGIPGAPMDLAAAVAQGTLHLAWYGPAAGGDATSYRLEAGSRPGAAEIGVDLPSPAMSAALPGVPPGRYFVRLIGLNEFGIGPASEELAIDMTAGTTRPGRPRIVSAAVVNGLFTMTWEPPTPSGDVTGYVLETGTAPTIMNLETYRLGPVTTLTYVMRFGGVYFLRLRAVNAAGVGPASAEVMVRAGSYQAPPPAPLGLTAAVQGSTVTLTWTAGASLPGEAPLRYRIEAGPAEGVTAVATTVPPWTTTLTVPGVAAGRYYVRVRGESFRGQGAASNEVRVVVP